jgi:glutaconate CoA-transferase, subunit B
MSADVAAFLARAAREFRGRGWVFTGFHWPVLAGELAARLDHAEGRTTFAQLFEAGAVTVGPAGAALPTSTTDYAAYDGAIRWRGTTTDVLAALVRRADRVVLDAANVDLRGRVNSSMVGPGARPTVRLPGGGGAADAAAAARDLVLLHGGGDPRRIVPEVEHVTAAPGPGAAVTLLTRWGTLDLAARPRLVGVVEGPGSDRFLAHLAALGVVTDGAAVLDVPPAGELRLAREVLEEAAGRGYAVARAALG